MEDNDSGNLQTLHMLLRFRRLMGRLLLLMLGLVVLGGIGLKRHAAPWAVQTVFAGAALAALAMLLAPLFLAFRAGKPSRSRADLDPKRPETLSK